MPSRAPAVRLTRNQQRRQAARFALRRYPAANSPRPSHVGSKRSEGNAHTPMLQRTARPRTRWAQPQLSTEIARALATPLQVAAIGTVGLPGRQHRRAHCRLKAVKRAQAHCLPTDGLRTGGKKPRGGGNSPNPQNECGYWTRVPLRARWQAQDGAREGSPRSPLLRPPRPACTFVTCHKTPTRATHLSEKAPNAFHSRVCEGGSLVVGRHCLGYACGEVAAVV